MTSQHQKPNSPAAQVEKYILENACTSYWLRSTYQQVIRRDSVDALNDAEVLVCALRARTLEAMSECVSFQPEITATLLNQHADALSHLSKFIQTHGSPDANFRVQRDISTLVLQLHQIARELRPCGTIAKPLQTTDGVPAPGSRTGQSI